MFEQFFDDHLICPQSGSPLQQSVQEYHSSACNYPIVDGIPWLFKNPQQAWVEWSAKTRNYLQTEQVYLRHIQTGLNASKNVLSNQRLSRQHEARTKNLAVIKKILAPFLDTEPVVLPPSSQQIYSYFQLFFRDWCWGKSERERYSSYVLSNIPDSANSVLVLGSGAGGLSYDLANGLPEKAIASVEHNPFLALASNKLFQGKSLKLYDYSVYPVSLDTSAQKWEIKVPRLAADNHRIILSAFPYLPFTESAFDVVIAPWFFDILDQPFVTALQQAIRFLKPAGRMIFFGPANIHTPLEREQLCSEEICSVFESQFESVNKKQELLPYLHSPLDAQNREESVLFVSADNPSKQAKAVPPEYSAQQVNFTAEFEQFKIENETFYKILSHIDGSMSYRQLADKLESEFGFSTSESEHYAELFIKKIEAQIYRY